jgi:MFS family permease
MLKSPLRIIGRFPRPVRLLIVGTLVNKLGTFIIPYLALVLLRDFHMREAEAARLLFAYGVGSVVSILTGGVVTDRFGRRRTLLVSLLGSGTLAVAMGVVPSSRLFAPLLVAFGFIADLYRPAASAIIGDLLPSSDRASGFAGLRVAVNLGWASGTAIGGLLADWNWRLLFLGDGMTTLAFGALVYFTIPETRPPLVVVASGPPAPAAVAHGLAAARPVFGREPTNPLRDRAFLATTLAGFLLTLIFCSNLSVLPLKENNLGVPQNARGQCRPQDCVHVTRVRGQPCGRPPPTVACCSRRPLRRLGGVTPRRATLLGPRSRGGRHRP